MESANDNKQPLPQWLEGVITVGIATIMMGVVFFAMEQFLLYLAHSNALENIVGFFSRIFG